MAQKKKPKWNPLAKDLERLLALKKDLESGTIAILETSNVLIALDTSAAFVLEDLECHVLDGPNTLTDKLLEKLSKRGRWGNNIVEEIRTQARYYTYQATETSLKRVLINRGLNKLFHQHRAERGLDSAIRIAANLEVFNNQNIDADLSEKIDVLIANSDTPYPEVLYDVSKEMVKKIKNKELSPGATISMFGKITGPHKMTLREAIELEKKKVTQIKGFSFGFLLLAWLNLEPPIKQSKKLLEKLYYNELFDTKLAPITPDSQSVKLIEADLTSDRVKITGYHYIAVSSVLAKLRARLQRYSGYWIVKGKVSRGLRRVAENRDKILIDSQKISELTGRNEERELRYIKQALWELPDIDMWMSYNKNDREWRRWGKIVHGTYDVLEDKEKTIGAGLVELTLPETLWQVETKNYALTGARPFCRILELPRRQQTPAARLLQYFLYHSNGERVKRVAYIGFEKAAKLLGCGALYSQRQWSRLRSIVKDYLDKLQEVGEIDGWNLQENGSYLVVIGL